MWKVSRRSTVRWSGWLDELPFLEGSISITCVALLENTGGEIKDALKLLIELPLAIEQITLNALELQLLNGLVGIPHVIFIVVIGRSRISL